jgi:hypothetical protein
MPKESYEEIEGFGEVRIVEFDAEEIKRGLIETPFLHTFYSGIVIAPPKFSNEYPTIYFCGVENKDKTALFRLLDSALHDTPYYIENDILERKVAQLESLNELLQDKLDCENIIDGNDYVRQRDLI